MQTQTNQHNFAIIFASMLNTHRRDEFGNRVPIKLKNENKILTNIKKYVKAFNKLVVVANNPNDHKDNLLRTQTISTSFKMAGIEFNEIVCLDNLNAKNAKQIIESANMIILNGGKCFVQHKFLKKIKFKKHLANFNGLVIGISAGAMNLCNIVYNFPEELADLKYPIKFKGLGYLNKIIIPHFDGENIKYQFEIEEVDIVGNYVLPYSNKNELIGFPNNSYILLANGTVEYFGNIYKIYKQTVKKL